MFPSVLLLLSGISAVVLGFFAFESEMAVGLIKHLGYWVMLCTFVLLLHNLWLRLYAGDGGIWRSWRGLAVPGFFIGVMTLVLLVIQPTGYKITMDEPVLAATALRMHEYKEVMTTIRAHEIQGVYTQLDGYVDKRPYFYPFLVSLLHDLTGYRSSNGIVLNALLTPIFLGLLYICGGWAWPRHGGYLAVLLFASVPLLAMNVNGGGFELLNLVMLLGAVVAAKTYLEAPSRGRLDTLILVGLLLAQTRYESVLYVGAVALVGVVGWCRVKKILVSPVTILAPLLLIPFPLQQIIFSDYEQLWQLKEGVAQPFLLGLIPSNLEHACVFFFNLNDEQQPNSLLLSGLFVIALVVGLLLLARGWRKVDFKEPNLLAVLPFAGVVLVNFFLLMAYHWGQLDDIIATRIVLPFILLQVLFVIWVAGRLPRTRVLSGLFLVGVSSYLVGVTLPLCARSDFLRWVPSQHEALWVQAQVQAYRGESVLFVTNKHLVALVERRAAMAAMHAKSRKERLDFHLQLGSYEDILFIYPEEMGEAAADGVVKSAGGTDLTANFDLEILKKELVGNQRYMCLSRLKGVKWLADDVRALDLSGYEDLEAGDAQLQFYARTLP